MNIAEVLHARAAEVGDAEAIVERDRAVTFAQLDRLAAGVAEQLTAAGIGPGDRALVLCPMGIALYATLIGLWRLGAVAMFVDPSAGPAHVDRCCRLAAPRAFVASRRAHVFRLAARSLWQVPLPIVIDRWAPRAAKLRIVEGQSAAAPIAAVESDTPALITFTSGSTGLPKAAVRSHGFLLAQQRVLADDLHLRKGQRDLSALPIFVLANLAAGVTSIMPDVDLRRPADIATVPLVRQIRAHKPNRIAASPALLHRLARHMAHGNQQLAEFREIYTGGGPVYPRLLRLLQTVASGARVFAVYGSTEAEPIATIEACAITADDVRAIATGSGLLVGRPIAAIDLRIVPDQWGTALGPYAPEEFRAAALPANAVGEIVVAGDHVLGGYLGGAGDVEAKFRVGGRTWHRTGDAGYLDSQGRLWLLGRAAAKIADTHGVVYPFAVECAALEIDEVRRCALVAHANRRVLVVELEWPPSPGVRELLRSRLEWAHLADVLIVEELPMDARHNAKVDYPALRRVLRERLGD